MISKTDLWVIYQLFERVENEELSAQDAINNLKEYISTYEENDKNI